MSDPQSPEYMAGYEAGALAVLALLKGVAQAKCKPLRAADVGDAYGVLGGTHNFVLAIQSGTETDAIAHLVQHRREFGPPPPPAPVAENFTPKRRKEPTR